MTCGGVSVTDGEGPTFQVGPSSRVHIAKVGPSADAGRRPCDETDAHMMSGGRVRAATRRVEDALLHEYDHLARRTGG